MKKLAFIFLCAITGCAESLPPEKVGKWCESNDGGKTCFGYTSYFSDGISFSYGVINADVRYVGNGRWYHNGSLSCMEADITFIDSNTGENIDKANLSFCNEVVSITDKAFSYKDDAGVLSTMYRLSKSPNKSMQPTATASAD